MRSQNNHSQANKYFKTNGWQIVYNVIAHLEDEEKNAIRLIGPGLLSVYLENDFVVAVIRWDGMEWNEMLSKWYI